MTADPSGSLTEFFLARLAEDEAAAPIVATEMKWRLDGDREWNRGPVPPAMAGRVLQVAAAETGPDPRVLAVCEAHRRIVELHAPVGWYVHDGGQLSHRCTSCMGSCAPRDSAVTRYGVVEFPCPTIRALAAVYADHPDYRPEWTP